MSSEHGKKKKNIIPEQQSYSLSSQAPHVVRSLDAASILNSVAPLAEQPEYQSLPGQYNMQCNGYDYNFTEDEKVLNELRCSRCKKIAKYPYVSPCGHIYCKEFVVRGRQSGSAKLFRCFSCKKPNIDLKIIYPDKAKYREINHLLVKCENAGCDETVSLPSLRKHMRVQCLSRTTTCRHCFKVVKYNEMVQHRETECKHAGRCEYVPLGCTDEKGCSVQHTVLKTGTLENLELLILNAKELVHRAQVEFDQAQGLDKTLDWQWNEVRKRPGNIDSLGQDIEVIGRTVSHAQGRGGVQVVQRILRSPDGSMVEERTNVNELVREAEDSFERDMVKIVEKLKNMGALIEEQMARIKNIKQEIEDRTRRYRNRHHLLNQDGMMIYPMKNFSKLRNESVQGKNKRILTASYKTHPRGYTFTGIVYPNGDGAGENSHISQFISMNKTEFDDIIRYPFSGVIQFSVINQVTHTQEMIMRFRSDMSQTAFKRPTQDFNPSTGIPRLVSLEELKQPSDYLVDDNMFLMIRSIPDESYKVGHNIALLDEHDTVDQPYDTQLVSASHMHPPTIPNEYGRTS